MIVGLEGLKKYSLAPDAKLMSVEKICQSFKNLEGQISADLFDRDEGAFTYNPRRGRVEPVYAVTLLLKEFLPTGQYMGHVYTWISPSHPSICFMIGIRSTLLIPFLRGQGKDLPHVALNILNGVREFCLSKGGSRIFVINPVGIVEKLLKNAGFESYYNWGVSLPHKERVKMRLTGRRWWEERFPDYGNVGNVTFRASKHKFLVKEDLSKPFI
jgi:hypothetical protein